MTHQNTLTLRNTTAILRDYQLKALEDIFRAWDDSRSVLFQMPTGTGKTTLFCEIAKRFIESLHPTKKVLIVTHRTELVEQVWRRLANGFDLRAGIIAATYINDPEAFIQVASIQTLTRRKEYHKDLFSLVIIDEAHHALATTYSALWQLYPSSKFLGVTATPVRTNGHGFHKLFDQLVCSFPIKWFINNQYLTPVKYYASHTPDLDHIKINAGDYDESELSSVMQDERIMADLVQSYIDLALTKKMIVFAVDRMHCLKITERYNKAGFKAKYIDRYTTSEDRRRTVEEFRNSDFQILCNVNIFTEGFDCPDVDAVQLARPTKSLSLFFQQIGRAMRPAEGKSHCLILDNAGLWKEHGLPTAPRSWTLNGSVKSPESDRKLVGQKVVIHRENKEPKESSSIQLTELDEIQSFDANQILDFENIKKTLVNIKANTMNEQIEHLTRQINKLQDRQLSESDEDIAGMFNEKLAELQAELKKLQNATLENRLQQVLALTISKCQEVIDENNIFIEGDKDAFLQQFIFPHLSTLPENSNGVHSFKNHSVNNPVEFIQRNRAEPKALQVIFQDGTIINKGKAIDTFIATIKHLGLDIVRRALAEMNSTLISDRSDNGQSKSYKVIPGTTYYINDYNSTPQKKQHLERIARHLKIPLRVEMVDKNRISQSKEIERNATSSS